MSEPTCPHCGLPPILPDPCTPEVHAVIQARIDRDWELFNAGYEAGKRAAVTTVPAPGAPART